MRIFWRTVDMIMNVPWWEIIKLLFILLCVFGLFVPTTNMVPTQWSG